MCVVSMVWELSSNVVFTNMYVFTLPVVTNWFCLLCLCDLLLLLAKIHSNNLRMDIGKRNIGTRALVCLRHLSMNIIICWSFHIYNDLVIGGCIILYNTSLRTLSLWRQARWQDWKSINIDCDSVSCVGSCRVRVWCKQMCPELYCWFCWATESMVW